MPLRNRALQQLARCGSLLGDDILYGISDQLAEVTPTEDRAVHLVLQMPRELMRYPWELLRDRHGWLVERFAIGRQVIADAERAPRWVSNPRQGPLRLLVVAPTVPDSGAELSGAGTLEGSHVADCFARLLDRLPGVIDPSDYTAQVDRPVTVEEFRDAAPLAPLRHRALRRPRPLRRRQSRSELLDVCRRPPLRVRAAADARQRGGAAVADLRQRVRRGARGRRTSRDYHDGVYGMATAALSQGVAAYVGPLWKISDMDAKNIAAAFYEALLIRRTSLGEALALARRSVREGEPDLDELVTQARAGDRFGQGFRGRAQRAGPAWFSTATRRRRPAAAQSAGRRSVGPEGAVVRANSSTECRI